MQLPNFGKTCFKLINVKNLEKTNLKSKLCQPILICIDSDDNEEEENAFSLQRIRCIFPDFFINIDINE